MVNPPKLRELLQRKLALYDALLVNAEKQNKLLDTNQDLLNDLQEEWIRLSEEINKIDYAINSEFANQSLEADDLGKFITQLTEKAAQIKELNDRALQKLQVKLKDLKQEIEGVKKGQQTASAYKMVAENISTYIDKKS